MTKRSITGRPEISAIMREVWSDQIDWYGLACPVCQMEGQTIECNVYVPVVGGEKELHGCCRCCSVGAHSTPELAMGSMKASYHCPGVGVRYAEHGDFGQTWDLKNGRFTDLNVDIPVLLVAHPASTVGLPIWQLSDIPATELSRQAAKKLLDGEKWRIELVFDDRDVTGHLIRLDRGDRGPVVWDSHTEGQAFGGIMEVVSRLVARLASADFTDAVAARSE
jgi:hypothetical protein